MSREQKLIQKIQRQSAKIKRLAPDYEKINLQPDILATANGGGELIAEAQRRADDSFGFEVTAQKIQVGQNLPAGTASIARVSYMSGHALQLTLSDASAQTDFHIGLNDLIEVQTGLLIGHYYYIVSISSANVFILDADAPNGASYPGETGQSVRHYASASKPQLSVIPSEQV